ncbi:hypothetical protein [Carboxylicivirga caseinilyticus]|uniref:hypothetical protein n=1 Tax=Carboxylicivirga caseinilyticus TaxID=3417572 RepID=UPI003D346CE0|nr:hypothetical protein [Marinilabiliaceae bacterium A049]
MIVNLKCGECKLVFPADVGTPTLDEKSSIVWEKKVICPRCKAIDKELLTEMGQSQMTQFFFGDYLK